MSPEQRKLVCEENGARRDSPLVVALPGSVQCLLPALVQRDGKAEKVKGRKQYRQHRTDRGDWPSASIGKR